MASEGSIKTEELTGPIACKFSPKCGDPLCPNIHGEEIPTIEDLHSKCTQLQALTRAAKFRLREKDAQLSEVKARLTALQAAINTSPQQQWAPPPPQWTPPPTHQKFPTLAWTPLAWTPPTRVPHSEPKGKGKGSSNRSRSCAGR